MRCTFAGGLAASDRIFAAWTDRGYQQFDLPEIGETVTLQARDALQILTFRYEGGAAAAPVPAAS